MYYLFPNPSPYELISNNNKFLIVFNTIFAIEKEFMKSKNSKGKIIKKLEYELIKYKNIKKYLYLCFFLMVIIIILLSLFNLIKKLIKIYFK